MNATIRIIVFSISIILALLALDQGSQILVENKYFRRTIWNVVAILFLLFFLYRHERIKIRLTGLRIGYIISSFLFLFFLFIYYLRGKNYDGYYPAAVLAIFNLSVAAVEEFVFRQYLFVMLFRKNKLLFSLMISSIVFGVSHLINLMFGAGLNETINQALYATGLAILFGALFIRFKLILVPILFHAIINFLFAGGYNLSESIEIVSDQNQVERIEFQFSLVFPIATILGLLIVYSLRNVTYHKWIDE